MIKAIKHNNPDSITQIICHYIQALFVYCANILN